MQPIKKIITIKKAKSSQDLIKENVPKYLNQILHVNLQTHGYGTFKKRWISSAEDLTFSFVVTKDATHRIMLIRLSMILHKTLSFFKEDCLIKPPNDIHTKKGKLAGILIEEITLNHHAYWVCGIGINRSLKSDSPFKSDALKSEFTKKEILDYFLETFNTFDLDDSQLLKEYISLILKVPLIATYERTSHLVTSIDLALNVHTEHFIAPIEWVTFECIYE